MSEKYQSHWTTAIFVVNKSKFQAANLLKAKCSREFPSETIFFYELQRIERRNMEKSDEHTICDKIPAVKSVDNDVTTDNMDVVKSNGNTDKLKLKFDDRGDDEKCVNNQNICNKRKNVKTSNKTDCNVVIDDGIQSKQQQQQQQQHDDDKTQTLSPKPSTYGCVHYKRKAKFVVSS